MIIGITGGIGTGKSTVSDYLRAKGYNVIDADKISREVIKQTRIKEMIVLEFGQGILENPLDIESEISRDNLRKLVFNNRNSVIKLNSIMHPTIIENIKRQIEIHKTEEFLFVDVPLLFETKLEYLFDKIALVYANQSIQVKRVMGRDNIEKEDALKIINSQMNIEEKKEKSDFVIENEVTVEELKNKIDKFLDNRRKDENKKSRI